MSTPNSSNSNEEQTVTEQQTEIVAATAAVVAAFVGKNGVRPDELPGIIRAVSEGFRSCGDAPAPVEDAAAPILVPAVSVKKSVTPDFLTCLETGKKFKSLKRHLMLLGMTPDQYRAKWNLPRDYPMVAPAYAAKRSELARAHGLGRKAAAA